MWLATPVAFSSPARRIAKSDVVASVERSNIDRGEKASRPEECGGNGQAAALPHRTVGSTTLVLRLPAFVHFQHTLNFLSNPRILWASRRLEDKHLVLKLTFADRLRYCRNQGFRTPETTLPFKALDNIKQGKCDMAERAGFEPAIRG